MLYLFVRVPRVLIVSKVGLLELWPRKKSTMTRSEQLGYDARIPVVAAGEEGDGVISLAARGASARIASAEVLRSDNLIVCRSRHVYYPPI